MVQKPPGQRGIGSKAPIHFTLNDQETEKNEGRSVILDGEVSNVFSFEYSKLEVLRGIRRRLQDAQDTTAYLSQDQSSSKTMRVERHPIPGSLQVCTTTLSCVVVS